MLTEDYIVRMIRDMGQMLARVLGSQAWEPDRCAEVWEAAAGDCPPLLEELKALCGRGEINAAENLLFEEVDPADKKYLEMALAFYMYLNEFDDDFLYTNNYSREEIVDGINAISAEFGITGFEHFVDTTMV